VKKVYLSLGSNIGDREGNLRDAIARLRNSGIEVARVSSVYETDPVDYLDQPAFLNLVVEADTSLFPMQLLARIHRIESLMGRKRIVAKGPRTIDIDILLFGSFLITTDRLMIPHPRMMERRFVLQPLLEISPSLRMPGSRRAIAELLAAAPPQRVRRIGPLAAV
jgi:2-amino-4-hydroxy-6-hydroxymethyldihydropteridine diphosphokinase